MSDAISKCPADSPSTARHFVRQWAMWRKKVPQKASYLLDIRSQNVWQSTQCLPDILSSTLEIILAITAESIEILAYRCSLFSHVTDLATNMFTCVVCIMYMCICKLLGILEIQSCSYFILKHTFIRISGIWYV